MKLRRMFTMTTVGVITAGALIGATGTGPASASETTFHRLCVDGGSQGNRCISADGALGWEASLIPAGTPDNFDEWLYPDNTQTNYIDQQTMTGEYICLQVNASEGYAVLLNFCVGDAAEAWENVYIVEARRTVFVSKYDPSLCLTADYQDAIVKAEPCTDAWYQEWGSS